MWLFWTDLATQQNCKLSVEGEIFQKALYLLYNTAYIRSYSFLHCELSSFSNFKYCTHNSVS